MTTTEVDPPQPPPVNKKGRNPVGPRILLGVTGSVAAIKAPEVVVQLVTQCNAEVKVVLSRGGNLRQGCRLRPGAWERPELLNKSTSTRVVMEIEL
jgi:hypothetical protein